jgi:leucyl/phenylalanyl-tRNA--protein transferase
MTPAGWSDSLQGAIKVKQAARLLTPELILRAYASGVFPMAESRWDPKLYWIDPDWRTVFPLDRFHVPRRLKRTVCANRFDVRVDTNFSAVIRACAAPGEQRQETWINTQIVKLYTALHEAGHVHSVECWREENLVGGLYGLALGGAFFGESMFSRERDASKVALVHLHKRLCAGGYHLFDVQFMTSHLRQFGAVELPRADYLALLREALETPANFYSSDEADGARGMHSSTQTS